MKRKNILNGFGGIIYESTELTPEQIDIHYVGHKDMGVFAKFVGECMHFPKIITEGKGESQWVFSHLATTPQPFIGRYAGYAIYLPI